MISIFNIVEVFASPGFPLFVPKIVVVSFLEKDDNDPKEIDLTLTIKNNTTELITIPTHVNFQDKNRNRVINTIASLLINNPGFLEFILSNNGQILNSYKILINPTGLPTTQTASS